MMKNFSRCLLLTTLVFSGSFTMPSWAKDCPEIPKELKQLTVKSNASILRKEPSQDSEKGVSIIEGDKLKVIDHTPRKDLSETDSYCWYLVSKAPDQETYFIADINIKEAPFPNKQILNVNSQNKVSSEQKPKVTPIPSNKETHPGSSPLSSLSNNWPIFLIVILGISFGVIIIINRNNLQSLVSKIDNRERRPKPGSKLPISSTFSSQEQDQFDEDIVFKNNLSESIKSIKRGLNRIENVLGFKILQENLSYGDHSLTLQETLENIDQKLNQVLEQLQSLSQSNQSHETDFKLLKRRVEDLEVNRSGVPPLNISAYGSSSQTENWPSENQAINSVHEVTPLQDGLNLAISPQLQEIINRFNHQRPELFNDFSATPLTLTSDSIQGKVGMNARRIVQLAIPADSSQATYLKFDLDNTAWLIPNIKSPYITKIMRNLSENPEIFVISPGSGSELTLIKPAQLKPISSELWEIEEPGEFTNQ